MAGGHAAVLPASHGVNFWGTAAIRMGIYIPRASTTACTVKYGDTQEPADSQSKQAAMDVSIE